MSPQGNPNGATPKPTDKFDERSPEAYVSGAAPDATVIPFRIAENPWMRDAEDAALAKCIYRRLDLSPKTVRNHVSNIFAKLQVTGRAEAIIQAREAGFGR